MGRVWLHLQPQVGASGAGQGDNEEEGSPRRHLMPINVRYLLPLMMLCGALGATVWSLAFTRLPPADYTLVNGRIRAIDPTLVTGVPEGRVVSNLFEGLTTWNPRDLSPLPGMAERWEVSPDQKTYTFHLRSNARWTDGTPVKAEDFVYSYRRLLHPASAAEYSYELWYVPNAERYSKQQVSVGDSVEIELREQPPGALPYAPGILLRGKLAAIEPSGTGIEGERVYTVEIDGKPRKFCRGGVAGEDYQWLLVDFGSIPIRAVNSKTFQVTLKHPVPYFIDLVGFYPFAPVPRWCVEKYGGDWTKAEHIVTNGPFKLGFRRLRDRVRMIRNEDYWDRKNVHLAIVDALSVDSITTMLNLYLTGQADWIEYVPPGVTGELLRQKRPDFQPGPYLGVYYLRLNVTRGPLRDVRVRRAFSAAIQRKEIVDSILQAGQAPALSFVPPGADRHAPYTASLCQPFDVAAARRLLAEAGYPEGRGFPKMELQFNESEINGAIAELLQFQLKQNLGIEFSPKALEWGAFLTNTQILEYDLSRAAWIADYPDPDTFLKMWITDGGNNQTGWSNPEYDALLEQAHSVEIDPANPSEALRKRSALLSQAERILMDELPVIPIFHYVTTSMSRTYVKGYYPNLHDFHPLKGIWIDQEEKRRVLGEGL